MVKCTAYNIALVHAVIRIAVFEPYPRYTYNALTLAFKEH